MEKFTPEERTTPNPYERYSNLLSSYSELVHTKRRTSQVEFDIEQERTTLPKTEFDLLKRISTSLLRLGKKTAQITAFISTLGLQTPVNPDNAQNKETVANLQERNKHLITEGENGKIKAEVGIDIISLSKAAGFEATMEVPSETGEYILHIGQVHNTDEANHNPDLQKIIVGSQKNIEKVLLGMNTDGTVPVFAEAILSDGPNSSHYLELMYGNFRKDLDNIQIDSSVFKKILSYAENWVNMLGDSEIEDDILTKINYLCNKRALVSYLELKARGMLTNELELEYATTIQTLTPKGYLKPLGTDAIYYLGAAEKLSNEGLINVQGAETSEGNNSILEYSTEWESIKETYFNLDLEKTPLNKIQEIAKKYNEIKNKRNQVILEDRENIAVQIIDVWKSRAFVSGKIIPLVFGNNHDFKNNVEESGQRNGSKFGLIKLSPKKSL